jgi:hypothetical protein
MPSTAETHTDGGAVITDVHPQFQKMLIQYFAPVYAGRRTTFAPGKSLSIFQTLLTIGILRIFFK